MKDRKASREEEGNDTIASSALCAVFDGVNIYDDTVVEGLPVHTYLYRDSNIDLDTVQILVEAYPRALVTGDVDIDVMCCPIYVALSVPTRCDHRDILNSFLNTVLSILS